MKVCLHLHLLVSSGFAALSGQDSGDSMSRPYSFRMILGFATNLDSNTIDEESSNGQQQICRKTTEINVKSQALL